MATEELSKVAEVPTEAMTIGIMGVGTMEVAIMGVGTRAETTMETEELYLVVPVEAQTEAITIKMVVVSNHSLKRTKATPVNIVLLHYFLEFVDLLVDVIFHYLHEVDIFCFD